jgi:hypothetical protein
MRISALNTSTQVLRQSSVSGPTAIDSTGKLYKASLQKIAPRVSNPTAVDDGQAFVYAKSGIQQGKALSSSNVVLENADGSRFNIDTTSKTVSLVAKGKNIDLYVFTPSTASNGQPNNATAVKYSFDQNGVMKSTGAMTELTAMDLSDAEITTKRDLDNNGKVGGTLDTATISGNGANSGKRKAADGIFKVNVMGKDLFVVGSNNLEKQKNINAKGATLLSADGTAPWAPTEAFPGVTFSSYRAIQTNDNANNISWTVYATANSGEVTRFQFDSGLKLKENAFSPVVLTNTETVNAEATAKRDFNADGDFGVKITASTDTASGLYKADVLGTTVYLSKTGTTATDRTGASPVNANGSLLKADGKAWEGPGAGYEIASMIKTGANGVNRTVFAYAVTNNTPDTSKLLKFNFTASGNNFSLDATSTVGISVTADEMATAEKTAKRDLNKDGVFGVNITNTVDSQGGLYKGNILGKDFFIAGSGLRTGATGSLAQSLTGSLLNADKTAWAPASGYSVTSVVAVETNGAVTGYNAYAYKSGNPADRNDLLKYTFAADGSNWAVTDATKFGVAVTAKDLAIAEATTTRDLNGDSKFGVDLTVTALDETGGLFKGQAFGQTYILAGTNLSSSANSALNLSKALLKGDGTAWESTELADPTGKLRVVVDSGSTTKKYTVFATTNQGSTATTGATVATYAKYTFGSDYIQTGNAQNLTAEEFAAAEKTAAKDLNADNKYGVVVTDAVDSRSGLYKGNFDGKTGVYFKGNANLVPGSKVASEALDFGSALKTATGYWAPDSGFSVKSAVSESANTFSVIATDSSNNIKKYVFDTSASGKNSLLGADSGEMKLADLVALENSQTTPRDLNGDGITGISVTATHDAVGGLFKVSAGGQTIVSLGGASAAEPTDLSKALLKADGTNWSATGTVDRYTVISSGSGASAVHKVYAKVGSDITEYTFGSDYKLDPSKTRSTLAANDASSAATLDAIKLADVEKDGARDINGDNVIGAKITKTLVTGTLYEAQTGTDTYTVMNDNVSGNTTGLVNAALLNADGSKWTLDTGYTIKAAVVSKDSATPAKVQSTEVYALNVSNAGKRYTFGADGKLLKTDTVTAEQIADAGNVGSLNASAVDSDGGLFKATVLGADFYVVGTGTNNGTAPVNLTQALLLGNTGTAAAWSPNTGAGVGGADGTGFKVGGLVTNKTGSTVTSYNVYAYKTDAQGAVTDVFKSTWDASFTYQGTQKADAAALVDVEKTLGRDLNKDGAFGFQVTAGNATEATYKGVSFGKVGGSTATFILASADITPGTASAPLGLNNALLNSEGTAAWAPDSGFKITAVTDGSTSSERYVYAVKAGTGGASDEFKRYEFTKATGKSLDSGVSLTAVEMAKLEVGPLAATSDDKDLNGDGQVGAVSVSDYRVLDANNNATGRSTGLLSASMGGKSYFVVNSMPASGGKLDLSKALLKTDGTAWTIPTGFAIKGIFEKNQGTTSGAGFANDDVLEVYGTNSGALASYKFQKQVDDSGNYTGAYIQMAASVGSTLPNAMTGFQVGAAEYDTTVDLNNDGIVGFKADATPFKFESPAFGSLALGKASVGTSQIYFVTNDYADTKADKTGADIKGGALKFDDGQGSLNFWSPTSSTTGVTYGVKSIVSVSATEVEVWAEQSTSGTSDGFVKFTFEKTGSDWVLDGASYAVADALTLEQLVAEEAGGGYTTDGYTLGGVTDYTGRDLNNDGVVGLAIDAEVSASSNSSIFKAHIGTDEYYLVGSNLSSGTEANPLQLDATQILMEDDGTTVWAPTGAVTNWTALDPQGALAAQTAESFTDAPTHKLLDGSTEVYFTHTATGFVLTT